MVKYWNDQLKFQWGPDQEEEVWEGVEEEEAKEEMKGRVIQKERARAQHQPEGCFICGGRHFASNSPKIDRAPKSIRTLLP